MISTNVVSIGIDSVEIERFKNWYFYKNIQLKKIFSQNEIEYCREFEIKSAERFAVRFCAKEAAYKAFNHLFNTKINLIDFCKYIEINKSPTGCPTITLNWEILSKYVTVKYEIKALASMTHTRKVATSVVILISK